MSYLTQQLLIKPLKYIIKKDISSNHSSHSKIKHLFTVVKGIIFFLTESYRFPYLFQFHLCTKLFLQTDDHRRSHKPKNHEIYDINIVSNDRTIKWNLISFPLKKKSQKLLCHPSLFSLASAYLLSHSKKLSKVVSHLIKQSDCQLLLCRTIVRIIGYWKMALEPIIL